jgi:zinc protease
MSANANPNEIAKNTYYYKLDNGLQLIVKTDHKSPSAVHMVWYKVGSVDELPHKTGLSHILEHIMFKGTLKYPNFSKVMAGLGASENAFTSSSYTVYHQQLPSKNINQAIAMEADRMRNLNFNDISFQDKVNKELKVIQEERRMRIDDQPESKLYEQMLATAYLVDTTRTPTIGWMQDIQKTSIEDLQQWYKLYYRPDNATVVVVGDVDPENIYAQVKLAYNVYKNEYKNEDSKIKRSLKQEPEQQGAKYIEMYSDNIQDPTIYMLYKTVDYDSTEHEKEVAALNILATLLSGYDYAYLDKIMVKQYKIATNVSASHGVISRNRNHFFIAVKQNQQNKYINDIDKNSSLNLARKTHDLVLKYIDKISIQDLNRAKQQWLANDVYKQDSMYNTAMEIGTVYNNDKTIDVLKQIKQQIQNVSIDDVKMVINKYIGTKNQTIAVVLPLKSKTKN